MPDLYLPETERATKTKMRAFRIEIDNGKSGNKSVSYHQEKARVFADDGSYADPSLTEGAGSIVVPFADLAPTVYEIACPVTGQTIKLSGAAIALWLELDYVERATEVMKPKVELDATPTAR